jgi:phospholipase B1
LDFRSPHSPTSTMKSTFAAVLAYAASANAMGTFIPPMGVGTNTFSCPPITPSESNPTSVHRLRPNDIKVVGALGDSATAGYGARATSLANVREEARGASWTIGGDSDALTIPNLLRTFNPQLKGFSVGTYPLGTSQRGFGDVSVSGAISSNMRHQAQNLVSNMRNNLSETEFQNDWKLVSLWIGANDMCRAGTSTENYIAGVEAALDVIQAGLPRTFVNLVTVFDMGKIYETEGDDQGCLVVRPKQCPLARDRERNAQKAAEWQAGLDELVLSPKYVSHDFTVVLQPWYKDLEVLGNFDRSFLSPDCFHFNKKAHEFASLATWNNLFQPFGEKQTSYRVGEQPICPTDANPYLYTEFSATVF